MSNGNRRPEGWPHPASFPVGSDESRAAARALLEERENISDRLQVVSHIPHWDQDNTRPHIGPWQPTISGTPMRVVYVPPGTDEETLRQLLATL